ncbi:MAG TPA: hypothetical protein VNT52_17485 [Acidimicrobiales bacterium]|nr:hypothetical protein [Acidimicrobiales bacterium]
MSVDPMHAARLAQLEGAVCSLLREAANDHDANDAPDGLIVRLDQDGIDIEYTRGGMPVGGEGI